MTFQEGFEAGLWDTTHCSVSTEVIEHGYYSEDFKRGYFLAINWQ